MTTGKTLTLTRRTFVGKIMSLLFNMLSMLVITFLLRSKRLFISWLQAPSAVIEEVTLKPPMSVSGTKSLSHQTMITVNCIPDLVKMVDHYGALDTFVQISEWRFRRLIGLWIKIAMVLHSDYPVLYVIYIKEVEKVALSWILWAVLSKFKSECGISSGLRLKTMRWKNCSVGHKWNFMKSQQFMFIVIQNTFSKYISQGLKLEF